MGKYRIFKVFETATTGEYGDYDYNYHIMDDGEGIDLTDDEVAMWRYYKKDVAKKIGCDNLILVQPVVIAGLVGSIKESYDTFKAAEAVRIAARDKANAKAALTRSSHSNSLTLPPSRSSSASTPGLFSTPLKI